MPFNNYHSILSQSIFDHISESHNVGAICLASKSFQNSSFGVDFFFKHVINESCVRFHPTTVAAKQGWALPAPAIEVMYYPSKEEDTDLYYFPAGTVSPYIAELVNNTKYLSSQLRLLKLTEVTSEVINVFFGSRSVLWPRLERLDLEKLALSDAILELISVTAPNLKALSIGDCTGISDAGVEHISKLSKINTLAIFRSSTVTDAGLEHIAKLSGITDLNLFSCPEITNAGMEHVAKLANMTTLSLCYCNNIADAGMEHISKLSGLTDLNVSYCRSLQDRGLLLIMKLTKLKSLRLDFCNQITDDGLQNISALSDLKVLNTAWCEKVTDIGIAQICKCSGISSLNLYGFGLITDASMDLILSKLSGLTWLGLTYCTKISEDAKKKFKTVLPACEIDETH